MFLCSVRVVMDRASGIKRLETDDTMELHMHKAVPLRPAVNRWCLAMLALPHERVAHG